MIQTRPLIAVLDDEPQMCKALGRLLKTYGFEVVTFALGAELLAACASRLPNCLLSPRNSCGCRWSSSLATINRATPNGCGPWAPWTICSNRSMSRNC